jgi:hypothetical protein
MIQKYDQEINREVSKMYRLTIDVQRMRNVKTKETPVIVEGNWNHVNFSQKIPDQHTG